MNGVLFCPLTRLWSELLIMFFALSAIFIQVSSLSSLSGWESCWTPVTAWQPLSVMTAKTAHSNSSISQWRMTRRKPKPTNNSLLWQLTKALAIIWSHCMISVIWCLTVHICQPWPLHANLLVQCNNYLLVNSRQFLLRACLSSATTRLHALLKV